MKNFVKNFILTGTQSVTMNFPTEGSHGTSSDKNRKFRTELHCNALKVMESEVSEDLKEFRRVILSVSEDSENICYP